jgi:multidrug resistance protein, MATE family
MAPAPTVSIDTRLLRLAGPVALARLGIMGMGIADTVMVGQMAPQELSHQALGWAPTGPFLVAGIGLLAGVQVLGAQAIGAGKPTHAGAAFRLGLLLALAAGLGSVALIWLAGPHLLTMFGVKAAMAEPAANVARILSLSIPLHLVYVACAFHLEATQRPLASTVTMWGANIVNIAANWVLIPHLGAEGSAWATVISRAILAGALIAWIMTRPDAAHFGLRGQTVKNGPGLKAMLAVGFAAAVSQAAEAGAFSAMTVIAGRIGEAEVAVYSITLQLLALVFMIALGMAAAGAVLVGEATGARDSDYARRAGWRALRLNTIAMALAGLVVWLGANWIGRAFTADGAIALQVAAMLWLAALVMPPDGGQVVVAAALRARGDNWFPTFSHILAYVLVMPPLAFLLAEVMGQGVAGLLWAIFWSSVLSVAVLAARFSWLTRRESSLPPPPPRA